MNNTALIITIGDEILYGQTLDTNSHWISGILDSIHIKVLRKITVADTREDILAAFDEGKKTSDIIFITGGLGPTKDDLTKPLLAEYFDSKLVLFPEALKNIESLFEKAGREMTELNKQQAELPDKCEMIQNKMGTAPGMWIEEEGKIFISMPGVPYEMKAMMKNIIIPKIQQKLGNGNIHHKIIKTVGIPESKLADKIKDWETQLPENIKLAYLPSLGQVKLRLTSVGEDLEQIKKMTSKQVEKLLPYIDKYVYGYDEDELEAVIGKLLSKNNHTLATAESCTGGYLAHLITSIPGSSNYYKGSVISYANEVKIDELYVKESDIENFGAVSEEVVCSMAEGVRKHLKTDVALASSGIAGPDGGTEDKPVGTVWIAYADKDKVVAKKLQLTKDRKLNIQYSSVAALNLFRINYK